MRLLLLAILIGFAVTAFAQSDSTRRVDTTAVNPGFAPLPGMTPRPLQQSSHSIIDASIKERGLPGLGISVFNSMRGCVPGMNIDPYYQVDTLTWRNNSPLVVVDGVVFNQTIGSFYNLNAFEYDEMRMILGRNGTLAYGGGGGNRGAIVLHSRSGEGFTKPTFDFNTYTTYAWNNDYYSTSQWQLSNSLGYSQDFGKLDLRVSTNYSAQPPGDKGIKGPSYWRLKANIGYTLERFSARMILNGNTGKLNQSSLFRLQSYNAQSQNDLFQGNLILSYELTDWLSISSQASRTNLTNDEKSTSTTYSQAKIHDYQLDAGNVLLHANKRVSETFSISGTAGWIGNSIYSKSTGSATMAPGSSPWGGMSTTMERSYEVSTQAMLATVEVGFSDKLFVGTTFRRDFVDYYWMSDAYSTYSVFNSYAFNHLIDRAGKVLSLAKARASYGYNDNRLDTSVPRVGTDFPFRGLESTSAFETGLEMEFLKGRITFMGNYFQNKSYSPGPMTTPIDPATGYTVTTFSAYYNTLVDGFELLARMKVIENKSFTLATQLAAGWNTTSTERISGSSVSGGYDWPSMTPDWTTGWLNQVTFGRISFSMLIDASFGGYVYGTLPSALSVTIVPGVRPTSTGFAPAPPDTISITSNYGFYTGNYSSGFIDKTFVKLRDISVGYNFPLFTRMKGFVSVSLRNLVTLYSKSEMDLEDTGFNSDRLQKSASVNFSLQF